MNAGFVAGPWTSRGDEVLGVARGEWRAKGMLSPGFVVARVMTVQEGRDVQEATAHLLAAAPELLDALEKLVGMAPEIARELPFGVPMAYTAAFDKACVALAKARGEVVG